MIIYFYEFAQIGTNWLDLNDPLIFRIVAELAESSIVAPASRIGYIFK